VTFAGYPGSTGLETIRYRLTDPFLDPTGRNDTFHSEESIRLPRTFWCFDPLEEILEVNELPALREGHVTFGCLNYFGKINDPLLDLWARILAEVPASRFRLLAPRGRCREAFLGALEARGIDRSRVEFMTKSPRREYLAWHHGIDLVLDTFPYNGHTTSLDALWMGVPVVSLAGEHPVSRAGLSQMSNLGLPELVTSSPDEYVRIAVHLAQDIPRLAELRRTLRSRMQASPLMDAAGFARDIESAYRRMWQQWCESWPESSIP
jgi:predicted O-linked N-acetylglucosamine transferase (SPINDLY family)